MFVFISYAWILGITAIAAVMDVKSRTIPNQLVLVGFLGLMVGQITYARLNWESVLIGLILSLILWRLKFVGGGDSKLLIFVSAGFETNQLLGLYFAISLVGAVQALWWIYPKKDTDLPYGVSIFCGTLFFLLWSLF